MIEPHEEWYIIDEYTTELDILPLHIVLKLRHTLLSQTRKQQNIDGLENVVSIVGDLWIGLGSENYRNIPIISFRI